MEIQPIVIGTAGHIDHGKSSLVRALTGVDPDRLKEEKERGLTIDLGFAPLELPDGRLVGIVDVPGHERFIKNMVAGASGIDLVVLVVAADDGVMPQTREHLAIMTLLGVQRGLIALTKIDAVEPELVELAAEDVRAAVAGTFLEDAPLLPLSSTTGEGVDAFRERLFELAAAAVPRSADGVFRMPVQRVFSAKGFGTILTGIPISGSVRLGETLQVLPSGLSGKVRGIQAYRRDAQVARAGHSTALNLSDVPHAEVRRGFVVAAPGYFRAVRMVGARLRTLADAPRALENRTPVRLHTGTSETVGEVVLLDAERLEPGESGLVQVRLEEPVVCAPGDPFVLRLASPLVTLGGGRILEESRHRLKRFKGFVIEELARQEEGLDSLAGRLEVALLRAEPGYHDEAALAVEVKRPREEVAEALGRLAERGAVVRALEGAGWIHADRLEQCLEELRASMTAWFDQHALREVIERRDLRAATGLDDGFLAALLAEEERRGGLAREPGGKVRPGGRSAALAPELEELRGRIASALAAARFQPPSRDELAASLGAAPEGVARLLQMLVDRGELVHLGKGLHLTAEALAEAQAAVVENCGANGSLAIPELRDRLGTTRKFLIPLLEYFDARGLTLRQGPSRVLRRR